MRQSWKWTLSLGLSALERTANLNETALIGIRGWFSDKHSIKFGAITNRLTNNALGRFINANHASLGTQKVNWPDYKLSVVSNPDKLERKRR